MTGSPDRLPDNQRVVVTGVGAVTAIGANALETYRNALRGVSGISLLEGVPGLDQVQIGGPIKDYNRGKYFVGKDERKIPTFGLLSGDAAVNAGLDAKAVETVKVVQRDKSTITECKLIGFDPDEVGVEIGSAVGGGTYSAEIEDRILGVNPKRIDTFSIDQINPNRACDVIHTLIGVRGPGSTHATVCSSASAAIEAAAMRIRQGDATAMFAGGTDSVVDRITIRSFEAMRALSANNDQPEKASRPFDMAGDGFVIGEGAAVTFLESLESSKRRPDVQIYAELVGWANNSYPDKGPRPDPEGEVKAMRLALGRAGITPDMVNLVNAHAAGTPAGDPVELEAIREVFGERDDLIVNATKSLIGHTIGAAGAIGTVLTLLAMRHNWVHPTINLENPRDFPFNFVQDWPQEARIEYAMVNAFGLGGKNVILVFKKWSDS